jgi:hypothetical protein
VNLGLNFIWIPLYGVVGAGLASLVSYALQGGLGLIVFVSASGEPWRSCLLPDRSDWEDYAHHLHALRNRVRRAPAMPSSPETSGRGDRKQW